MLNPYRPRPAMIAQAAYLDRYPDPLPGKYVEMLGEAIDFIPPRDWPTPPLLAELAEQRVAKVNNWPVGPPSQHNNDDRT